jgi:hypothetical protein
MEDGIGEAFEGRPARLERRGVAADHDQHLARLGRRLAPRERHVDEDDAGAGKTAGEPLHRAGRDRGGDPDDQSFSRRGRDAVGGEQDGFRLLVEADDDNDEVAAFRHRARIGRDRDPGTLSLLARALVDIAGGHLESGLAQMARHRLSHLAEPDDTDAAHDALAHVSTFPVSVDRIVDAKAVRRQQTWRVAAARREFRRRYCGGARTMPIMPRDRTSAPNPKFAHTVRKMRSRTSGSKGH